MTSFWNQPLRPNTSRDFYGGMTVLAVSVVFILILFQPFGTSSYQHSAKYIFLAGYGLVILVSAGLYYEVISRLKARWFTTQPWTLKNEFLFLFPLIVFSISATYLYHFIMIGGRLSWAGYFFYLGLALATTTFPLTLVLTARILGSKAWLAHKALAEGQQEVDRLLTLHGENSQDTFTCNRDELVYLQASDNYVECFLEKQEGLQRHVVRSTLKEMEDQLAGWDFYRVHRSYLVNLDHIAGLAGRSPNYQLQMRQPDLLIPISRRRINDIRKHLAARPI